ncbi:hypothetical protein P2H44_10530 [Albimonas sp. CAU 1670]|uniref:hypothetical protein n=1 Tax=Albimonas sp. CAU 1670 TaxID=3032599 RepID=UPI0023DB9727|nr:hypothetical protein [Albimonas sp. CAU 1670]MDF2232990.1 hypothetical protein [Albimonas sp. CAU 1670]
MIRFLGRKGDAAETGGEVFVDHTHLYLGATCRLLDADAVSPAGNPVRVEFSDGVVASGRAAAMPGGRTRLEVAAYRTSKGARIGAKAWILEPNPEDADQFRVRASGD